MNAIEGMGLLLLIISKGNFNATVTLHLLWLHIPIDIESLDPQFFFYKQNWVIKSCIPKKFIAQYYLGI